MTTKEYVNEIKKMVSALQHHIYKTECFCESCANCLMHMACKQIILLELNVKDLAKYVQLKE